MSQRQEFVAFASQEGATSRTMPRPCAATRCGTWAAAGCPRPVPTGPASRRVRGWRLRSRRGSAPAGRGGSCATGPAPMSRPMGNRRGAPAPAPTGRPCPTPCWASMGRPARSSPPSCAPARHPPGPGRRPSARAWWRGCGRAGRGGHRAAPRRRRRPPQPLRLGRGAGQRRTPSAGAPSPAWSRGRRPSWRTRAPSRPRLGPNAAAGVKRGGWGQRAPAGRDGRPGRLLAARAACHQQGRSVGPGDQLPRRRHRGWHCRLDGS
jgi:hypothetical protein